MKKREFLKRAIKENIVDKDKVINNIIKNEENVLYVYETNTAKLGNNPKLKHIIKYPLTGLVALLLVISLFAVNSLIINKGSGVSPTPTPCRCRQSVQIWWDMLREEAEIVRNAWFDFVAANKEFLKTHKEHPGMGDAEYFVMSGGDEEDIDALLSLILSNSEPDVILMNYEKLEILGRDGYLIDLEEQFHVKEEIFNKYGNPLWKDVKNSDTVYGIPIFEKSEAKYGLAILKSSHTPEIAGALLKHFATEIDSLDGKSYMEQIKEVYLNRAPQIGGSLERMMSNTLKLKSGIVHYTDEVKCNYFMYNGEVTIGFNGDGYDYSWHEEVAEGAEKGEYDKWTKRTSNDDSHIEKWVEESGTDKSYVDDNRSRAMILRAVDNKQKALLEYVINRVGAYYYEDSTEVVGEDVIYKMNHNGNVIDIIVGTDRIIKRIEVQFVPYSPVEKPISEYDPYKIHNSNLPFELHNRIVAGETVVSHKYVVTIEQADVEIDFLVKG